MTNNTNLSTAASDKLSEENISAARMDCDHVWTDYANLISGDNPILEIETCLRCHVQRKKQRSEQQEWRQAGCSVWEGDVFVGSANTPFQAKHFIDTHNAALAAEREKVRALVDALFQCVDAMNTPELRHARCSQKYVNARKAGLDALAKVKEGK